MMPGAGRRLSPDRMQSTGSIAGIRDEDIRFLSPCLFQWQAPGRGVTPHPTSTTAPLLLPVPYCRNRQRAVRLLWSCPFLTGKLQGAGSKLHPEATAPFFVPENPVR
jgi:hypothetical protein